MSKLSRGNGWLSAVTSRFEGSASSINQGFFSSSIRKIESMVLVFDGV